MQTASTFNALLRCRGLETCNREGCPAGPPGLQRVRFRLQSAQDTGRQLARWPWRTAHTELDRGDSLVTVCHKVSSFHWTIKHQWLVWVVSTAPNFVIFANIPYHCSQRSPSSFSLLCFSYFWPEAVTWLGNALETLFKKPMPELFTFMLSQNQREAHVGAYGFYVKHMKWGLFSRRENERMLWKPFLPLWSVCTNIVKQSYLL